ncbi:MAG: hypothetical protein ACJASY_001831 [Halioglobus sp.]|jgi:hypothetical protein
MRYKKSMRIVSGVAVIALIAVLAWLTMSEEDPCANPQSDISAAVLAEANGDQDALTNRAIVMKESCTKE